MAKTKKMAFGGMGSMAAPKPPGMTAPKPGMGIPDYAKSASQQGGIPDYAKTAMNRGSSPMQFMANRRAPMQSRGALGGNQPPAGADLMQKYNNPTAQPGSSTSIPQSIMQKMAQAQPRGALGGNQPPAGANLMQAYQAQPGQGAGVPDYAKPYMAQAGQPTSPPAPKLAGMGAFMKKGGKVKAKAYAKGGTVSSASKRGDGCAQRGKTKGRMV